jgi:hypothetical protein
MTLDRHGQSDQMTRVFTGEAVLKIIGMSSGKYLKNGCNVFDLLIVTVSLIELGLANVKGLNVLRSFRLLRIFKLAKSWQTFNRLIFIIVKSIEALGNFTLIVAIVVLIFSVMGIQVRLNRNEFLFLFPYIYSVNNIPSNSVKIFRDGISSIYFIHSCKSIDKYFEYKILFFEGLSFVYYVMNGLNQCGYVLNVLDSRVFPFFLFTFVIGNLVILNLFLSLLLTSFDSNVLTKNEDEENKISEAIDRIRRFCRFILNRKQKKRN